MWVEKWRRRKERGRGTSAVGAGGGVWKVFCIFLGGSSPSDLTRGEEVAEGVLAVLVSRMGSSSDRFSAAGWRNLMRV